MSGFFFTMRMRVGLFGANDPNLHPGRRPILISDVDPLYRVRITHWGPHVGGIVLHISGPKADWRNHGCVREHSGAHGVAQTRHLRCRSP